VRRPTVRCGSITNSYQHTPPTECRYKQGDTLLLAFVPLAKLSFRRQQGRLGVSELVYRGYLSKKRISRSARSGCPVSHSQITKNSPAARFQVFQILLIARAVSAQLRYPVGQIRFWHVRKLAAVPVPEAPMHKNYFAPYCKYQIGFPGSPLR
jgi:hypothetical protein